MKLDVNAPLSLTELTTTGCGCCSPGTALTPNPNAPGMETNTSDAAVTTTFAVTGMTCGHCIAAVTEELSALTGVAGVSVDLVAGGVSHVTVTSDTPVDRDQVAAALDEAGDYRLAND